ncbi:MAG: hypothetical protein IJ685_12315 [Selenomonadaceae bacterium]|nr:hypothetical protein [Selenomonadaceae bacterium]
MKKFLVAAAASLLIFGSQANVEASTLDVANLDLQSVETQETGHWANFRDEVILGRESDRERRERKKWERREREKWERRERERWAQRHRYERPLPPPPNYGPARPVPPPPPRAGYGPPPRHYGQLPPPPPRMR